MNTSLKKIVRSLFVVKEKIYITPNYLRIIFNMTNEQIMQFQNVKIGDHNKLYIPHKNNNCPVIYEETIWESDFFLAVRTYTTRNIDFINKTLQVDFALHKKKGPASQWAENACPGDFLGIAMKEGFKPIIPDFNEYLLMGDSTAIPVISVILENLPSTANAIVLLEACSDQDSFTLHSKANVNMRWVYNSDLSVRSRLADEFVKIPFLQDKVRYTFIAGEFEAIKKIRKYIKEQLEWERERYHAVSYWQIGSTENESLYDRQK